MTNLERAVSELGAELMADGRYRYHASEVACDVAVSAEDLADYVNYMDSDDEAISSDAYSHWCAATLAEELPKDAKNTR